MSKKVIEIYTEDEICQMYRDSKKKKEQIGYLADLAIKKPEEIVEILERHGYDTKTGKKRNPEKPESTVIDGDAKKENAVNTGISKTGKAENGENTVIDSDGKKENTAKSAISDDEDAENRINTVIGENAKNEPFPEYIPEEVYPLVKERIRILGETIEELRSRIDDHTQEYARLFEFLVAHGRENAGG